MGQKEELFNDRLKEIFIGEEIQGRSGFANLMRIKSDYFNDIFSQLNEDIDDRVFEFDDSEEFREELYDKLYTFLKKYFSDSGSIYFTYTPLDSKIYEQVYDNQEDVTLFWKTHMLYYVKTDTIWEELEIKNHKLDGTEYDLKFDVSDMEGKKANEKKDIEFEINKISDGKITFGVSYSSYGMSDNKIDSLRRQLKKEDIEVENQELRSVFSTFRKQNEVDFFINKDAEGFLKEKFDLWLKEYLLDENSVFEEKRLMKIKAIRDTAYDIIDFVSQFEDELAKIWNKPKFALNSNYVVSLDKIVGKEGGWEVFDALKNHEGWNDQIEEWQELDLIEEDDPEVEPSQAQINGRNLNEDHKHLPVDTQHFEDLKIEIISLFDNLDDELDGRLIHSENYQALKTILPKYRCSVDSVYIDPPFNKEDEAEYDYRVKYRDASWVTLLENRIRLAKELMDQDSSIFTRCDYNGNRYVSLLLEDLFGRENFRNEMIVRRGADKAGLLSQFDGLKSVNVMYDNLYWFTKSSEKRFKDLEIKLDEPKDGYWKRFRRYTERPTMQYEILGVDLNDGQWGWSEDRAREAVENYKKYKKESKEDETIQEYWERKNEEPEFIKKDDNGVIKYWVEPQEYKILNNDWTDITGYSNKTSFQTENSEELLKRTINISSDQNDLVMDFFLGSGTTTAAAHKLNRNWIGVEMGEQFYDIVLPRMKKVVSYEPSGISRDDEVKESYNSENAGGFFKYYELEQYEQALKKCKYENSQPFDFQGERIYDEYVFMKDQKMIDALDIDSEDEKIEIDLTKIYSSVDIAETLSNVKGKRIRQINESSVEFQDGEVVEFDKIAFEDVKPLIWWN